MFLASSNSELSLTPRCAEVAVTELCPSNLPNSCKIHLNTKSIKVLTNGRHRSKFRQYTNSNINNSNVESLVNDLQENENY